MVARTQRPENKREVNLLAKGRDLLVNRQAFRILLALSFLATVVLLGADHPTGHLPVVGATLSSTSPIGALAKPETGPALSSTPAIEAPASVQPAIATPPGIVSRLVSALATLGNRIQGVEAPQQPPNLSGWITHYSPRFDQRALGCYGYGTYSADDPTIIAVNPTLYRDLPCGSIVQLCGPGGCIVAARKDSCPGCRPDGFDLSDAGFKQVCGDADGVCTATVTVVKVCERRHFGNQEPEPEQIPAPENMFPAPVPCQHPPV